MPHEQTVETWPGPFSSGIRRVRHCDCTDGKSRTATTTAIADTMFSQPARVQFAGRTVSGFISYSSLKKRWEFHATGKNRYLLPSIKERHALTFSLFLVLDEFWYDPDTREINERIDSLRRKLVTRLWTRGIDTHYDKFSDPMPELANRWLISLGVRLRTMEIDPGRIGKFGPNGPERMMRIAAEEEEDPLAAPT